MTQSAAAPADGSAIVAIGLVRQFGDRRALDGLTLEVARGGVFGLLGPNGCGKSTFLGLVSGMAQPDAGTLHVLDQPPAAALRARIGIVFQENAQDPLARVGEHLRLAAALFGLRGRAAATRVDELLERFGLRDRLGEPIATLSGGMRRRLEIARALLHRPELLVLDEPTTGVDPGERRALWEALAAARTTGATILLATNDLAEADAACDHVAFLKDGRVVASGAPDQLKRGLSAEAIRLTWEGADAETLAAIAGWPEVTSVAWEGAAVTLTAPAAAPLLPRLFEAGRGRIRSVAIEPASLADAYFHHVGQRASRPEPPR